MDERSAVNQVERRRWNDPYWTSTWPKRESLTSAVTATLHASLELRDGDVVLDVGSGAGAATMRVARAVGPSGRVLGLDVSAALVERATALAATEDVANVGFVVADAQTDPVPGGPFSLVMSQFGVMFFDHPVAAFANLRAYAAGEARLGFCCWQPLERNPWFVGPALRGLVPSPPEPAPGAHVTGPFAFGDPGDVRGLLVAAGWDDVVIEAHQGTARVDRDAIADPGQPAFLGVPEDRLEEAAAAVEAHLARFADGDGRYVVPIAYYVVTARTGTSRPRSDPAGTVARP